MRMSFNALEAPVGVVQNSLNSVVTGVGSYLPQRINYERPALSDPSSDEAFEAYKTYNMQVEKAARKANYYAGYFDKVATSLLIGAFAGVGVTITAAIAKATILGAAIGPTLGALIGGGILVGLALAVGFVGYQARLGGGSAQVSKEMDVEDFQIRRQAALIAKEIKSELGKETKAAESAPIIEAEAIEHEQTQAAARSDGKKWQQVIAEREGQQLSV